MTKKIHKKVWVVVEEDHVKAWNPVWSFTGAVAVFEDEGTARLALKYNDQLIKHRRSNKGHVEIREALLSLPKAKPRNTPPKSRKANKKKR